MTATLNNQYVPAHGVRAPAGRAPALRVGPTPVLVGIGLGGVAVLALWWTNTTTIVGLGDYLTNAGRITGLLAGYGAIILLGLMARVPALERGIGTDRLTRWHAMGGRYTVSMLVAHGLLITWGYAVTARTSVVGQGLSLIKDYPDVLYATIGAVMFVVIGALSARAARKRMSYEAWHLIHLGTYLAIALSFLHQFSTGADFVGNKPAQYAWSTLYGVISVLLLWYRVVVPVRSAFRHRLRVAGVRMEGPDVVSVYLSGRYLDELKAEPGQFFRWRFFTPSSWWASNPYSLSAPVSGGRLRITVKDAGNHSASLAQLQPGTKVMASGPYGAFTGGVRRRRKVLLIGAGVGITPLRALLETLPGRPGDITLIYRARHMSDLVLRAEIEEIAFDRGARVHYLVGTREQLGGDPLSAEQLEYLVPNLKHHDVYLCGPENLTSATRESLRDAGVARRRIHHESFEF
ncbi:ferric reductase-like transmembrane domain-containing protein [Cryptosporangium sp. NPDC048952]|uniref:ferredoxin reductase family protein n=1 Tax=Cryptosporangium sp. NPDC048952 TaxID=3363961 RepID=UPI00371CDDA5